MVTSRQPWLCCVVFLLFFASVPVFGQSPSSVSGCVQDPSHAVIRGASISLTRLDNSGRLQTQTDEKGCFTLSSVSSSKYRLEILAESFSPYEKDLVVENSVRLDDVVLEIRPVEAFAIVTATRTLVSSGQVVASVDVIDRTQIDASHVEFASDLLRNVAGIALVRTGNIGGITTLFTRGGESDYTKILIDGIPINQPGGIYDFAHLPTDNVGRVEVVRGSERSVRLGCNDGCCADIHAQTR